MELTPINAEAWAEYQSHIVKLAQEHAKGLITDTELAEYCALRTGEYANRCK